MRSNRFPKKQRLARKKLWEAVFEKGVRLKAFPLALYVYEVPLSDIESTQAGFAVPKRVFKRAVRRNRIKRLMREAYRLEKPAYFNTTERPFALVFLYLGKEMPEYTQVARAMKAILKKFEAHEATTQNKTDPAPADPGNFSDGNGVQK